MDRHQFATPFMHAPIPTDFFHLPALIQLYPTYQLLLQLHSICKLPIQLHPASFSMAPTGPTPRVRLNEPLEPGQTTILSTLNRGLAL